MDPKFDRVFVVTHGRSGSTLLQALLNAIPGYRIYGENDGFLFKLQAPYEALLFAHTHLAKPKNDNESQPWFGSSRYDEESVTLEFRRFVNEMLFQPDLNRLYRVFGFKEIKFNEVEHSKIDKYIRFVKKLFPNAAVVFNTRHIGDVLKSGWWKRNSWDGLPNQLSQFREYCDEFANENADYAIHISYDDLILADRIEAGRLFAFLGEPVVDSDLDSVFRGSHSYENRAITSYMTGRVDYITLEHPDWWRRHMDEFQIEIAGTQAGHLIAGVFLPASGSTARLFLETGGHRIELIGTRPTPKLESLFLENPAASHAGFQIEAKASEVMYLFGSSEEESETVVGVIRPRVAAPVLASDRKTRPDIHVASKH